ncbi:hypothetical protein [Mycolicibacterium neworleansense]|uniref:Luciferase n=1 Tax=Mycolicibacterium neworleansense TaxID=146018 RepID=A0A0H5RWL7_9MYCO|nr:hypothetical protein [Mycolicibacterium neworleansense]MCV7365543.1 hypothetical protein [Mycolicibacterium neworleansense]CRZ17917.1 luciferase [Mycolicibacterium neworleansense]
MRDMGLIGTPAEILDRVAEWRDCGVRHLVMTNAGLMQRSLRRGVATVPSFYRVVRGIKKL